MLNPSSPRLTILDALSARLLFCTVVKVGSLPFRVSSWGNFLVRWLMYFCRDWAVA
jgi:hypothetical protein